MPGINNESNVLGSAIQTGGNVVISNEQITEMMRTLTQEICDSTPGVGAAVAAAPLDFHNHPSYKHQVDGARVIDITPLKWKKILTTDVKIRDNDICNLWIEGLEHPKDLSTGDADKVDAIFKNMKSKSTPLGAQFPKLL